MKKLFLSLAILAVSSLSIMADDNKVCNNNNECKAKTECVKSKKEGRRFCETRAFEGLNLTDAQKAKLDELKKNCDEQKKKDAFCQNKECNKPGCLKKDCEVRKNMTPEQKKQLKAEAKAKKLEMKKKNLEQIKSILTPEQYTKFLENNYLSSSKMKHGKDGKEFSKGHHKGGKKFAKKGKDGKKSFSNGKRERKQRMEKTA